MTFEKQEKAINENAEFFVKVMKFVGKSICVITLVGVVVIVVGLVIFSA